MQLINRCYDKRAQRTKSPVSRTLKSTLNKMLIHESLANFTKAI